MRSLFRDAAYCLRLLRKNPGFTGLALLIIALGIGPTTAIFSLFQGVLLRSLAFRDPDRLMVLWSDFSRFGGNPKAYTSYADYFDWHDRARSFEAIAAFSNSNRTFTALDRPFTPLAHEVTANYFAVLGVRAYRGRTFSAGEDVPGHDDVAVMSYELWQSAFGGADSIVGSSVELDRRAVRLIGVLPPDLRVSNGPITQQPGLWVPRSFEKQRQDREFRTLVAVARLKAGVTPAEAAAEMNTIAVQVARENPGDKARPLVYAKLLRDDLTGDFRGTFGLLLGAVGLTLLIACANVANLLLARSSGRGREFALRTALGASRMQILRQMLVESGVLALGGGAAGVALAKLCLPGLLALVPASAGVPVDQVEISASVLAFAMALTAAAALFFGLAPARQAFASGLAEALKTEGRSGALGRRASFGRNSLIASEVALSLVLLMGAGLMVQTFWKLSRIRWGFEPAHLLHIRNATRGEAYGTPAARRSYFVTVAAKLAEVPGVESVTAISFAPPLLPIAPAKFSRVDRADDGTLESSAITLQVLPRYFETLRIPVLAGRAVGEQDTADAPRSVVVSQAFVRRYFPNVDPVGRSIQLFGRDAGQWRIVGVAGDVRSAGLTDEFAPIIYLPHSQSPVGVMSFLIRARGDAAALGPLAERTIWNSGRLINVYATATMEERLGESFWQSRFTMILLGIFAGLALALAAAGMYAVISYLAAQRTREIGIRIALGASPREVLRMVVGEGLGVAGLGVLAGGVGSIAFSGVIQAKLYGVAPFDPLTFSAVAIVLLGVAAAASIMPAIRAARVDPLRALHTD